MIVRSSSRGPALAGPTTVPQTAFLRRPACAFSHQTQRQQAEACASGESQAATGRVHRTSPRRSLRASAQSTALLHASNASLSAADDSAAAFAAEIGALRSVLLHLAPCATPEERLAAAHAHPRVAAFRAEHPTHALWRLLPRLPPADGYTLLAVILAGQSHVLNAGAEAIEDNSNEQCYHHATDAAASTSHSASAHGAKAQGTAAFDGDVEARLRRLVHKLQAVEAFYDSMGGIVGYQLKSLELIAGCDAGGCEAGEGAGGAAGGRPAASTSYHAPHGPDLAGEGGRALGTRVRTAAVCGFVRACVMFRCERPAAWLAVPAADRPALVREGGRALGTRPRTA